MLARKALAGTAGAPKVYVEDVFSCFLYTGNGSTQTITNNIDLSGEGGLVWIKKRTGSSVMSNFLTDTARGISDGTVSSNTTNASNPTQVCNAFNNNGFGYNPVVSDTGDLVCSWTFRKAEKFFDVVTYTGNGSNRTISHNLGSTPGCIMVKRTDTTGDWQVYHRANTANPETDYLVLNSTAATADSDTRWNDTLPTSTVFSLGTEATVNANGGTYVAYLFAHDAGGFGDAGSDSIIKCGSYSGTGTTNFISLGWEPQWVLVKRSDSTGDWHLLDNMRGWFTNSNVNAVLLANTSGDEGQSASGGWPDATGFYAGSGAYTSSTNTNGGTYIYIAIRRGPMKTPTSGTSVFSPNITSDDGDAITTGFPVDMFMEGLRAGNAINQAIMDRLRGNGLILKTSATSAESSSGEGGFASNTTIKPGLFGGGSPAIVWNFRRAPGFFDVVATDVFNTGTNVNHNLGVTPELVIAKARNDSGGNWMGAFKDGTSVKNISLNVTTAAYNPSLTWSDYFTSTTFNPTGIKNAAGGGVYGTSSPTVIYLFASLAGVSKIGTYTGNGSSVTVTTDFQPRFILVKRTDSTGNWIVGDSARGLVAADEPALFLNSTAAETTGQDWVDVSSTSFTVNETALNANVNTATYLYLAVA